MLTSLEEIKIGVLTGLLFALIHLSCIGLDIAIFFVAIRLFLTWRSVSCIEWMNDIGKRLVDGVTTYICQFWYRKSQKQLSEKGKLLFSIAVLLIARVILCEIARIF